MLERNRVKSDVFIRKPGPGLRPCRPQIVIQTACTIDAQKSATKGTTKARIWIWVSVIPYAVPIRIACLRWVIGERVSVITHSITIGVRNLCRIVRERIFIVCDAITVCIWREYALTNLKGDNDLVDPRSVTRGINGIQWELNTVESDWCCINALSQERFFIQQSASDPFDKRSDLDIKRRGLIDTSLTHTEEVGNEIVNREVGRPSVRTSKATNNGLRWHFQNETLAVATPLHRDSQLNVTLTIVWNVVITIQ